MSLFKFVALVSAAVSVAGTVFVPGTWTLAQQG
jgi:hypothetical protein